MNIDADFFNLERVLFFNGQRLTAEDLTAAQQAAIELRWLHNRSLHNWGIAAGMAVSGEKGAREVVVSPGYALDARGREIILAADQTLPVPPLSGDNGGPAVRDLTIAYPGDDEVEVAENRQGVCAQPGAVRLSELPQVRWLDPPDVRTGFDIVLARASIRNCQLEAALSLNQRRNARPPQQPVVACGSTTLGKTTWRPWTLQLEGTEMVMGYETTVDTSAARFHTTPRYLARVAGARLAEGVSGLPARFLVEGFVNVIDSKPNGFTLQVLMFPRDLNAFGDIKLNPASLFDKNFNRLEKAAAVLQQVWQVIWIGIEG